jgi:hypothetical protein
MSDDLVDHPRWYTAHPSGVECIELTETMDFNPGNALKYVWRHGKKGGIEDLLKALWYVRREIAFRGHDHKGMGELSNLSRVMAHEPSPTVSLIFWHLVAGDHLQGEAGAEQFREAERLIEGLIHETEPTTR